jgi:hypothetical protein
MANKKQKHSEHIQENLYLNFRVLIAWQSIIG